MGINIPDIMHMIQFQTPDFITLLELLQRLGQAEINKSYVTIAMIFIYSSQTLLDNMHILEQNAFKNL